VTTFLIDRFSVSSAAPAAAPASHVGRFDPLRSRNRFATLRTIGRAVAEYLLVLWMLGASAFTALLLAGAVGLVD
jgi:hypothetical protein